MKREEKKKNRMNKDKEKSGSDDKFFTNKIWNKKGGVGKTVDFSSLL